MLDTAAANEVLFRIQCAEPPVWDTIETVVSDLVEVSALLACGGVVLDRANVVVFAMNLRGPMPFAPRPYFPSAFEWGVSVGLIAATVFLFGWAARNMPVLPKEEQA